MRSYYRIEFRPYRIKQNTSKRKQRTYKDAISKLVRLGKVSINVGRGNHRSQDIMNNDHYITVL